MTVVINTLTIIVPDNLVIINGTSHTVDCSGLVGMHAVQWNSTVGEIEYVFVNGSKFPPTKNLTDISMFQPEIDAWNVVNNASLQQPAPYSISSLISYARHKQIQIAQGGFVVNVNPGGSPVNVSVSTSHPYNNMLSSAVQLAQMMIAGSVPSQNINWDQDFEHVVLTPQQVVTMGVLIANQVQSTFNFLIANILPAIKNGTITTTSQIDSAAWPINS